MTELQRRQEAENIKEKSKHRHDLNAIGTGHNKQVAIRRPQLIRTFACRKRNEPQLNQEIEPGNFGLPDHLLFMIGSTKNSSKRTS